MRIDTLIQELPNTYSPADRELVERAYRVAEKAHEGQKRASGEPYINHCVAVADILAEMRVPPAVVAAGLLHDTVEDTSVTPGGSPAGFWRRNRPAGGWGDQADPAAARLARRPADENRALEEEVQRVIAERRGETGPRGRSRAAGAQPQARPGARDPAQNLPGDGRRCARGADQAGRPPAQHAHAQPYAGAQASSASPRRHWISLPRWPTAWASGRSNGSWRTWPFATSTRRNIRRLPKIWRSGARTASRKCRRSAPNC